MASRSVPIRGVWVDESAKMRPLGELSMAAAILAIAVPIMTSVKRTT